MRPAQVLDCHADLLARSSNEKWRDVIGGGLVPYYANDPNRSKDAPPILAGNSRFGLTKANADAVAAHIPRFAQMADTFQVTPDMSMLIQHAADGLDELDRTDPTLAPTEHGLCFFERPLPLHDARDRTMLIHWMLWGPTHDQNGRKATLVITFNDAIVQPDEISQEIARRYGDAAHYRQIIGRWETCGMDAIYPDQRLGPALVQLTDKQRAQIIAEGDTPSPGTNMTRYIHALWMLLDQTIVSVTPEDVDRHTRRRMGKVRLPSRVSVIALRRKKTPGRADGESLVEWSHQWIVKGHKRWVPHGPRTADHEHVYGYGAKERPCQVPGCENALVWTWIAPFVKGPSDKPLVQTAKVYQLRR